MYAGLLLSATEKITVLLVIENLPATGEKTDDICVCVILGHSSNVSFYTPQLVKARPLVVLID